MNEKAFEKVERDLNLATGEVKITEDLIKLDSFRTATSASWSPICLKDELPPSIHAPFYVNRVH